MLKRVSFRNLDVEYGMENFVLQFLGTAKKPLDMYKLHAEAYLLMENAKALKDLVWVQGIDAPEAIKLNEMLVAPKFFKGCWEVISNEEFPDDPRMKIVQLTDRGHEAFSKSEYNSYTSRTMDHLFQLLHNWYDNMPHDVLVKEMHTKFPNMCL